MATQHTPKRNPEQHREKMADKAARRGHAARALVYCPQYRKPELLAFNGRRWFPALVNRHTGKPHEHKREIARRLRAA